MRRLIPVILLSALAVSLPARARASEILAHERYTLANGLDVILQIDRKLPLVAANLSSCSSWSTRR
jgi:hypothetical protein